MLHAFILKTPEKQSSEKLTSSFGNPPKTKKRFADGAGECEPRCLNMGNEVVTRPIQPLTTVNDAELSRAASRMTIKAN